MANRDNQGRFLKGESGNPNGRPPKGETLTDALMEHVDKHVLAAKLVELALEKEDVAALKYIYDRIDGRPTETVHNLLQNLPDVIEID